MSILYTLHLLSAGLWVGGMFFAYFALRPVAASLLQPPLRLPLWNQTFKRFFVWVWGFVIVLPISGYSIVFGFYQGMGNVPITIHIMQLTGWIMIIIFAYVYWVPYRKMRHYLADSKLPEAGQCLNHIRKLIAINLTLGIATIIVASLTRF